jgi:AraC-like DNA-binding protein
VEFLKEILDSAESNLKIDNLYTKVGFTSKSSMYTSFKEFVGMTPNQYLKEVLKSKNVK